MNFQGLHRTIQFSISSLALGKRQKHNISQIFAFANRFLKFFRFFFKTGSFKISRSAKFSVLYQPRCIVAFDAQQKHNISSFRNFASVILKFFEKFVGFQGKLRKIKGKNRGWTGVLVVGQVRQVGQVGQVNWYAMCQSPTIKPAGLLARKHRRLAYWSTRGRTCRTCRTSRTGWLVCRVPLDNNKTSRFARAENTVNR